jgi:hypothetical protein
VIDNSDNNYKMKEEQKKKTSTISQCKEFCVELTRRRFHQKVLKGISDGIFAIVDKAQSAFITNIPSEDIQNLASPHVYIVGGVMYAIMASLFVVIFYFTFKTGQNERFLSIATDDMNCEEVLRPFTGDYLVDEFGNWEGSTEFAYTHAIYSFGFSDFLGSEDKFYDFIQGAFDFIENVGVGSKNLSLAGNVMLWIGYQNSGVVRDKRQVFRFAGSSPAIFDSPHRSFGLGDVNGTCKLTPQIIYDRGANKYRMEYSAAEYLADKNCTRILNPFHVKYMPVYDQDSFRIEVSVDSIVTATAINLGILVATELHLVKNTLSTVEHKGKIFEYGSFYYPRFPGMEAIICVIKGDQEYACSLSLGNNLYGLPVFNHFGSNITTPTPCNCLGDKSNELLTQLCNQFTFLPGLVFYEWDYPATEAESLTSLLNLILDAEVSGTTLTANAFYATNDAVNLVNLQKNDSDWRKDVYAFCNDVAEPNTRCSVSSFFIGHETSEISDFFYPLYYGACNDSFTVSKDIQKKIKENPPLKLVEGYSTCKNKDFEVFNNSVGVTTGNIGAYFPILIILFVIGQQLFSPSKVQTYSKDEKQAVIDFLALHLLLARDNRYTPSEAEAEASIIVRLKSELGSAAAVKRFHSDNERKQKQMSSNSNSTELGMEMVGEETDRDSSGRTKSTMVKDLVKERLAYRNDYIENPLFVEKEDEDNKE